VALEGGVVEVLEPPVCPQLVQFGRSCPASAAGHVCRAGISAAWPNRSCSGGRRGTAEDGVVGVHRVGGGERRGAWNWIGGLEIESALDATTNP
jgi:hypothetical protein